MPTDMNGTSNNPALNRLGPGVTAAQVQQAVQLSGYPLQRVVTELLMDTFKVTEEWGFADRATQELRSLDLFAYRRLRKTPRLQVEAALLVECKRSTLPFVFFEAVAPRLPAGFPLVAGLRGRNPEVHASARGSRTLQIAEFMRLQDFDFISNGPPMCSYFARSERKGKSLDMSGSVPFNQIVLPLISAAEYFMKLWQRVGSRDQWVPASVVHPVCVVDGPMVLARGGPKATELLLCPWVRILRQEAAREQREGFWRHHVVDFVHRDYVSAFLEENFLPFTEQFAERAVAAERFLTGTKAVVSDLNSWQFKDLESL